jgi:hypothetical protein
MIGAPLEAAMRLFAALFLIVALAACHPADEENVQTRAENESRQLQDRYNAIEAEAGNSTDAAIAPIDNETANFLNQANGAAPANGAGNAQ